MGRVLSIFPILSMDQIRTMTRSEHELCRFVVTKSREPRSIRDRSSRNPALCSSNVSRAPDYQPLATDASRGVRRSVLVLPEITSAHWSRTPPGGEPMSSHARKLTTSQEDRLSIWRAIAEKKAPYTAALLYAARYVNVPGIETLGAVDDRLRVFLDLDGMDRKWTDDENAQVLIHLMYHVMFDHHGLAVTKRDADGTLSPDLWRMAADAAINDDLEDAGHTFPSTVSTTAEKIGAERGLSVIEYYDTLASRAHAADMEGVFSLDQMTGDLFGGALAMGTDLADRASHEFLPRTWQDRRL